MNDDFEQRLREQRLRPIPAEWRSDILAAAREATSAPKPDAVGSLSIWNLILARFPSAWGALAALWAVLIGANVLLSGSPAVARANLGFARATEPSTIWRLQRAELRQLANGDDVMPAPATAAPNSPSERPRSDQRREERFGEYPKVNPRCPLA